MRKGKKMHGEGQTALPMSLKKLQSYNIFKGLKQLQHTTFPRWILSIIFVMCLELSQLPSTEPS
jgi:hypothetical protein